MAHVFGSLMVLGILEKVCTQLLFYVLKQTKFMLNDFLSSHAFFTGTEEELDRLDPVNHQILGLIADEDEIIYNARGRSFVYSFMILTIHILSPLCFLLFFVRSLVQLVQG